MQIFLGHIVKKSEIFINEGDQLCNYGFIKPIFFLGFVLMIPLLLHGGENNFHLEKNGTKNVWFYIWVEMRHEFCTEK